MVNGQIEKLGIAAEEDTATSKNQEIRKSSEEASPPPPSHYASSPRALHPVHQSFPAALREKQPGAKGEHDQAALRERSPARRNAIIDGEMAIRAVLEIT